MARLKMTNVIRGKISVTMIVLEFRQFQGLKFSNIYNLRTIIVIHLNCVVLWCDSSSCYVQLDLHVLLL